MKTLYLKFDQNSKFLYEIVSIARFEIQPTFTTFHVGSKNKVVSCLICNLSIYI